MSYMKSVKPNPNGQYNQGYYHPVNPLKYISDNKIVIYRSSLEKIFCITCDTDPTIVRWISEPDFLLIRYVNPFKKKVCTYYPDFYMQCKTKHDPSGIMHVVVELKAHSMMYLPIGGDTTKMTDYAKRAYVLNQIKKKAAEIVCAKKGMKYLIMTEKSEFFKRNK